MVFGEFEEMKAKSEGRIKAQIYNAAGFSGHADINEMLYVFGDLKPKAIYIVH